MRRLLPVGLLLLVALGGPARALAQGDKAAAESLFQEGKALMDRGDYEAAIVKLRESQRQDPSSGTLLNLGRCYQLQGKLASAWAEYTAAAALARSQGRRDKEEGAAKLAADLEPRLTRLRIDVAEPVPGLSVLRGGVEVGSGSWATAMPVDPGEHLIEARAPGHVAWSTRVQARGEGASVSVTVPKLAVEAPQTPPAGPPTTSPQPAPGPPTPAPPREVAGGWTGLHTAGVVVGSLGIVSLAAGAVLGAVAMNQESELESDPALCPGKRCSDLGLEELAGAKKKAIAATGCFASGGVAAATGIILVVVGSATAGGAPATTGWFPWVGRDVAGIGYSGSLP